MATKFTEAYLRTLKPQARVCKITETGVKGEGRLLIKVLPSGRREFYYRYRPGASDKLIALGRHQQTQGSGGITLAEARAQLAGLIQQHKAHGDVKEHRKHLAGEAQRKAVAERRTGAFGQLLDGYVAQLRKAGKTSADDVDGMFRRHVRVAFPELLMRKARDVGPEDIRDILARMVGRGITRAVNIMRANLHAAFEWGGKAEHNPLRTAENDVAFDLSRNPAAIIGVVAEFNHVGDRVLSADELRLTWNALEARGTLTAKTVQFALVMGGQRLTLLLRATWRDLDDSASVLVLRDSKGRGGVRDHLLPLSSWARDLLELFRLANGAGEFIFSSTGGAGAICLSSLSHIVESISTSLEAQSGAPKFRLGDLRRTAETSMASIGVDRETRAWLLSHGRSGVQSKHYDRHSYLNEKAAALAKWERFIKQTLGQDEGAAKVIELQRAH